MDLTEKAFKVWHYTDVSKCKGCKWFPTLKVVPKFWNKFGPFFQILRWKSLGFPSPKEDPMSISPKTTRKDFVVIIFGFYLTLTEKWYCHSFIYNDDGSNKVLSII